MKKQVFLLFLSIPLFFASCEKEGGEGENETKISTNFSDESHNTGTDCMTCHVSGGSGEGWFTVAGSVYENSLTNPFPNATVKLSTEPQAAGTIVKTIEVDQNGNFYTTENVSFGTGLYVSVIGKNGEQAFMNAKITNGSCTSCHGNTTNKIGLN